MDILLLTLGSLVRGFLFLLLCIFIMVVILAVRYMFRDHPTPIIIEARCRKCGELFCPADDDDLVHFYTEYDEPCGGRGKILRKYYGTHNS